MERTVADIIAPHTTSEMYKDFAAFSEAIRERRTYWSTETLPTAMLERIAKYQPGTAKRIFELACVRPIYESLKDRELNVTLSDDGKKWVEHACDRFMQEPGWAMSVLEGVLVLEMIEPQARLNLRQWFREDMTLEEFRQKPLADTVAEWARRVYSDAYMLAHSTLNSYVQIRAYYIAIVITACVDGGPITDEGIKDACAHRPTHDEIRGEKQVDRQASLPIINSEIKLVVESLLGAPCVRF